MKKYWKAGLALLLAGSMSFVALTACNGGTNSGSGLNGDADPDEVETEQLTESQWKDAFAEKNYKNFSMRITSSDESEPDEDGGVVLVKYDASKKIIGESFDGAGNADYAYEAYLAKVGNTYYSYYQEEGAWTREETDEEDFNGAYLFTVGNQLAFGADYSAYTYDEDAKAYKATNLEVTQYAYGASSEGSSEGGGLMEFTQTYESVFVKIVDGKLAVLECKDDGYIQTYMFYDFGKTKIELPKIEEPIVIDKDTKYEDIVSEVVTEDVWRSALAAENFANVTFGGVADTNQYEDYGVDTSTFDPSYFYIDGDIAYLTGTSIVFQGDDPMKIVQAETFYEKTTEDYRVYRREDGGAWEVRSSSNGPVESYTAMFAGCAEKFADFTYDATKGAYVAENVTVDDNGHSTVMTYMEIKIINGKVAGWSYRVDANVEGKDLYQITYMTFFDYGKTKVPALPQID